jgi:predicted O-methyltransferase YrrM
MQTIRDTTSALLWFLKRPRFYQHLAHLTLKKFSRTSAIKNNTRAEATEWCARRSIDSAAAIQRLTGRGAAHPIDVLFPDIFTVAALSAAKCPVRLGGAGDLTLLYCVAQHLRVMRVVETGVAYGWSSLALLLSLKDRPGARLVSTDMPYLVKGSEQCVGCVVPDRLRAQWSLVRAADRQALPGALETLGTIDMCHYDSDKSYEGRMWAYPKLWQALRPGGVFISDDIDDNVAFREFSDDVSCEPLVVRKAGNYVGILVKDDSGRHGIGHDVRSSAVKD